MEYAFIVRLFSDNATKHPNFNAIVGAEDHALDVHRLLTYVCEDNLFSDNATKQANFVDIMAAVHMPNKIEVLDTLTYAYILGLFSDDTTKQPNF